MDVFLSSTDCVWLLLVNVSGYGYDLRVKGKIYLKSAKTVLDYGGFNPLVGA